MALQLFNSLTKRKEEFRPIDPGKVRMYVCGPTVYDEPHVGHLRSAFTFEVIRRWFETAHEVRFVRNVTDVDDKIIEKAASSKPADLVAETKAVSSKYYDLYAKDLERLGVRKPTEEPRATGNIPEMIALIEGLIANGMAYAVGGDVYYEVRKFAGYGKLSHQNVEQMMEGVRVDKNEKKRDPLDFALWKTAKPGEPAWPSPWGQGRPGWHIECSAMSKKHLGETFDVHGGGRDLIFPHHENEVAQSEGLSGKTFANYWIHHGLITVNQVKMSKSLKNYVTLDSVVKKYGDSGIEELKLLFLGTHYSAPLDYSDEKMEMERSILKKFRVFFDDADLLGPSAPAGNAREGLEPCYAAFDAALNDDFNTPAALTAMYGLVTEARQRWSDVAFVRKATAALDHFRQTLGLASFRQRREDSFIEGELKRRQEAKKSGDFKTADAIRAGLLEKGIVIRDMPGGVTTWTAV